MARLSEGMLKAIMPFAPSKARRAALPILMHTALNYGITTRRRMAMWLATIAVESGELKYQAELASGAAYEGRADLGNTQKGDGRRFKGHGRIQITGRDAHTEYTKYLRKSGHLPFVDFVKEPHRLAEEPYATDAAGWFVNGYKNLNPLADTNNFLGYQIKVNGMNKKTKKPNHWAERQTYYSRALRALPDDWVLTTEDVVPFALPEAEKQLLESTDGWDDFITIPVNEALLDAPETQEVLTPASETEKPSEHAQTPANGVSDTAQAPPVDSGAAAGATSTDSALSPQVIDKERPSLFSKVMTAIFTAVATAVAGYATTCGSNEIVQTVGTKAGERAVENVTQTQLIYIGAVTVGVVIALAASIGLFWIASKIYEKSAERANRLNLFKGEAAADKSRNTVEFKDKEKPTVSGAPDKEA